MGSKATSRCVRCKARYVIISEKSGKPLTWLKSRVSQGPGTTSKIVVESGVCMPLVECGEQIAPLLRHVKDRAWNRCSPQWLDRIISMAEEYEESITDYKESDT